jgi:hypothetical protein
MDPRSAEEHLRVIRELMERATIYRTIAGPAALFCGSLALIVAALALFAGPLQTVLWHNFITVWIIVFLLSAAANTVFLLRSAGQRRESFPSSRSKMALIAIAPDFLVAAAFTLFIARHQTAEFNIAVFWAGMYGLALLSTLTFAPRSIAILGWAFVLTSCLVVLLQGSLSLLASQLRLKQEELGYLVMAATFGFYHVIYGLAVMFHVGRNGNG